MLWNGENSMALKSLGDSCSPRADRVGQNKTVNWSSDERATLTRCVRSDKMATFTPCEKLSVVDVATYLQPVVKLVADGLGPNSKKTLLVADTGHVFITNIGGALVKMVPSTETLHGYVQRMITEYYGDAGDGVKSLVLIFSQIIQSFPKDLSQPDMVHTLDRFIGDVLPNAIFPQMLEHVQTVSVSKNIYRLLLPTFSGRSIPRVETVLCGHLSTFLRPNLSCLDTVLNHVDESMVMAAGVPVEASCVLSGFLFQRDFTRYHPQQGERMKLVILDCDLDAIDTLVARVTFRVDDERSISDALKFKPHIYKSVVEKLKNLGVQLVVSTYKLSDTFLSLCDHEHISVCHCVATEDVRWLESWTHCPVIYDIDDIISHSIIETMFFKPTQFGASRMCHLGPFTSHSTQVCQQTLVICGHTNSIMKELKIICRDSVRYVEKCVASDGDEGVRVVPCGGMFELMLAHYLQEYVLHAHVTDNLKQFANLLQEAVLTIPNTLFNNSFNKHSQRFIEVRTRWRNSFKTGKVLVLNAFSGDLEEPSFDGSIEAWCYKLKTITHLLQILKAIIRLDYMLKPHEDNTGKHFVINK